MALWANTFLWAMILVFCCVKEPSALVGARHSTKHAKCTLLKNQELRVEGKVKLFPIKVKVCDALLTPTKPC